MAIRDFIDDIARCVGFLSRLPVPPRYFSGHDGRLNRAARAFPVAGVVIALPAAVVFVVLSAFDVDPLFSAFAALAVQTLVTGALHEDGLSDTADGLGGGRDRETALAIMKDSRIGTYGAVALVLSFGFRASALAAIAPALSPWGIGMAVLAAAALGRTAMVGHWSSLPPARADGVAASVGTPDRAAARIAYASGAAIAAVLLLPHIPVLAFVLTLTAATAAVLAFNRIAQRKIGGHTGDTIGAGGQLAEIATLATLAITL